MIKRVFIKITLLMALNVSAQQLSTSGQSNLKFYNKAIERLQKMSPGSMGYQEAILDAEKKISSIKKTDPGYDVSAMEAEIQKYKSDSASANDKKEQDWKAAENTSEDLDAILNWTPANYKNSKTDADFAELDKKVNEQIDLISNFCKSSLNSSDKESLSKIEGYWEVSGSDETKLVSTKNNYEKSEGVEYAVYNFYQIKWIYNKWNAFSQVFPSSKSVAEAKQKSLDVLNMLGSAENARKHAQGARAKRIAETKMEPAAVSDPPLEAQIKAAILKSKFGTGKTVVKVNIHSSSWSIQKNSITGAILSRTKGFSAALKGADGSCSLLHYVDYKQDYAGGSYGQGYINLGEVVEILCENIK